MLLLLRPLRTPGNYRTIQLLAPFVWLTSFVCQISAKLTENELKEWLKGHDDISYEWASVCLQPQTAGSSGAGAAAPGQTVATTPRNYLPPTPCATEFVKGGAKPATNLH